MFRFWRSRSQHAVEVSSLLIIAEWCWQCLVVNVVWLHIIASCGPGAMHPYPFTSPPSTLSFGVFSFFRSTPPTRPNNISGSQMSVCPSVHKVPLISMKLGMQVEVDEWCMTVCSMTRSKVKVTSYWKSKIRPFSKATYSPIYNGAGKWPLILKLAGNT